MEHVMNINAFLLNEARNNNADFERFEAISDEFVVMHDALNLTSQLTNAAAVYPNGKNTDDWKKDYNTMLKFYEERGMDEKTLKTVVKDNLNVLVADEQGLFAACYFDMFFYVLTGGSKKVYIGGRAMMDYEVDSNGLVKFSYGWHKTSYGKLFIKHHMGNEKKWFGIIKPLLKAMMEDQMYHSDKALKKNVLNAITKAKQSGSPVVKLDFDISFAKDENEVNEIVEAFKNGFEQSMSAKHDTITVKDNNLNIVLDFK